MITILVNGTPYTDFVSAQCAVSLESLCNDFSFTTSAVKGFPPFKYGDTVTMLVDDVTKVTAPITRISGNEGEGAHEITYSGRDLTSNLVDSDIDALGDISTDKLTLKRLIELVIEDIGSTIKVIDKLNPAPFNKAEDYVAPQVGENAWEFIRLYAAKRQAILTSDGFGNILITQSEPVDSGARLQKIAGSDTNNILSQDWEIDNDKRFNRYVIKGQLEPMGLNFAGDTSPTTVVSQAGIITDSDIQSGRQKVSVEGKSYSNAELDKRAKWAKQLAKAAALRYNCTVKGHSYPGTGAVWKENTLVQVNSESADITRKMLIGSITFSEGEGRPTTTALGLVEKNVYTINSELLASKKVGKQNDVFFG